MSLSPTAQTMNPKPKGKSFPFALQLALGSLVFCALVGLGFWLGSGAPLARLVALSGAPHRDTSDSMNQWFPAVKGDEFFAGDAARTGVGERAFFKLDSGARLTLSEQSQIRFQATTGHGVIGLSVDVGEIDLETDQGILTVTSEFGEIEIAENSAVRMRRNGSEVLLTVEVGMITVGEFKVRENENIRLTFGGVIVKPKEPEVAEPAPEPAAPEEPEWGPDEPADLVVGLSEAFTVHDPSPPTAIGFRFRDVCPDGATLQIGDQEAKGKNHAVLRLAPGKHEYTVRCIDSTDAIAGVGSFSIVKDAGTRALPKYAPTGNVVTDGRHYKVMYQHKLPSVHLRWPTAPQAESYVAYVNGKTYTTSSPSLSLPSGALRAGTHKVAFAARVSPPASFSDNDARHCL